MSNSNRWVPHTLSRMDGLPNSFIWEPVFTGTSWHTWILDNHYESGFGLASRSRTHLGELLYRAKYRNDRAALDELSICVRHSALQIRRYQQGLKSLESLTAVAAVPCNPPKSISIPHRIAQAVAVELRLPDISTGVVKTQATPSAKANPTLHPEAYRVDRRLDGQSVLLIDDLYHTGMTLESVATQLRAAGADHVVGLCVTKVHRGMTV